MPITFETQEEFEDAVMDVLSSRLGLRLTVNKVSDGDYYRPGTNTRVEVALDDVKRWPIVSAKDEA